MERAFGPAARSTRQLEDGSATGQFVLAIDYAASRAAVNRGAIQVTLRVENQPLGLISDWLNEAVNHGILPGFTGRWRKFVHHSARVGAGAKKIPLRVE